MFGFYIKQRREHQTLFFYSHSASNNSLKCFKIFCFTSFSSICLPNSTCMEVTPFPRIPHGIILSKKPKSALTLSAKPCMVTQREARTPIAQIFRANGVPTSNQTPVSLDFVRFLNHILLMSK